MSAVVRASGKEGTVVEVHTTTQEVMIAAVTEGVSAAAEKEGTTAAGSTGGEGMLAVVFSKTEVMIAVDMAGPTAATRLLGEKLKHPTSAIRAASLPMAAAAAAGAAVAGEVRRN